MLSVTNLKDFCMESANTTHLTYSQLINYYNELVIQLRLAEYILNVTINLEVKQEHWNKTLETEKQIIKLLNETVLPVLESTVSHYFISYVRSYT